MKPSTIKAEDIVAVEPETIKDTALCNSTHSKVEFRDAIRSPMIGTFVKMFDHEHLVSKNMIRFVPRSKELFFEQNRKTMHTRVFVASDFISITSCR